VAVPGAVAPGTASPWGTASPRPAVRRYRGGMDGTHDGDAVAASLSAWLDRLTFTDRTADEVTTLLVDAVARWGAAQGWRVYRRAPSVVTLPPPYQHQHSFVDIGCARPHGVPVVVEVDHGSRRRTVDKLCAEAAAGRLAVLVRWGGRTAEPPPAPVRLVTCAVTARRGLVDHAVRYSRSPATARTAPAHSAGDPGPGAQAGLFDPDPGDAPDRGAGLSPG